MNAYEEMKACVSWLEWHHVDFIEGIRSPADALKLWRYGAQHAEEVNEMADTWTPAQLRKAIGYNPTTRRAA